MELSHNISGEKQLYAEDNQRGISEIEARERLEAQWEWEQPLHRQRVYISANATESPKHIAESLIFQSPQSRSVFGAQSLCRTILNMYYVLVYSVPSPL